MNDLRPLLRLNDFIDLLPIGRRTVWTWVKDGRFPKPVKLGGKVSVWPRAQILEWLEQEGRDV